MEWIVIWGAVAIGSSALAGFVANSKNRDVSWWMGWAFLVPLMLIPLFLRKRNLGPPPAKRALDDLDREYF